MKQFFNRLISALTLLLLLSGLSGCRRTPYRDGVGASHITAALAEKLPVTGGYESYDADFLAFYLPSAAELVSDFSVIYSEAPDDYTEIGVLHAVSPEELPKLEAATAEYLETFKTTYRPQAEQYDPSEREKIENAACRVYGNYVVYTIMTAKEQSRSDAIVKEILRAA